MTDRELEKYKELKEKFIKIDTIDKNELLEYLLLKAMSMRIELNARAIVGENSDIREIYKSIGLEELRIELSEEV
ncbi:MAG: hypothetical protein ACRCUR_03545 [Cetobacterium sp.]